MLFVSQIALLVLWFAVFPALPWWIVFLPAFFGAAWLLSRFAALVGVIIHDYKNKTHTPFFK